LRVLLMLEVLRQLVLLLLSLLLDTPLCLVP
jgi:hypothetical protein